MKTARMEIDMNERLATMGVFVLYLLSIWLLNGFLNAMNFGFWAAQDGSGVPIVWNIIITKRLVNPSIGWDHNSFSVTFPYLVLLLAAYLPFLPGKTSVKPVVGAAGAFFTIFWLLHAPGSFTAIYVPYYISIAIRTAILLAYVITFGWLIRNRMTNMHRSPIRTSSLRRSAGFTLIEMLVVIAIIATLAGILFPVMAKGKQAAQTTQDVMQLRQTYDGLQIYRQDYDENYPFSLADVAGTYVHKQVLASPADHRQPAIDGTYPANRFLNLRGEPDRRVDYKVSYAYLRAFEGRFPYQGLWDYYIQSSQWSILSCADYQTSSGLVPNLTRTDHGIQTDSGMYLRIGMDGSLKKAVKSGMGVSIGGSYEELFYYQGR